MATNKKTPGQQQAAFVDRKSLKNYATATATLTVVINIILYIYSVYKNQNMPNTALLPIAILLSILYVLSFFTKESETTHAQYAWITGLNAIMLFTSISGANGMLEKVRQSYIDQNMVKNDIQKASIVDVVKHIIFPTHGWFSTKEVHNDVTGEVLQKAISAIDTAQLTIKDLVDQKRADSIAIDTLTEKVMTLSLMSIQMSEINKGYQSERYSTKFSSCLINSHIDPGHIHYKADPKSVPITQLQKQQKMQQILNRQDQLQKIEDQLLLQVDK